MRTQVFLWHRHVSGSVELSVSCHRFECFISYHTEADKACRLNVCEIKGRKYLATVVNNFRYLRDSFATFQQSEGPIP